MRHYENPLKVVLTVMHRSRGFVLVCVALASLAATSDGQTRLLSGVVKDSLGAPIAAAAVVVGDDTQRTDSAGTFVIALPRTDSVTITVRRLGYRQVTFALSTDEAAGNNVEVVLSGFAAELNAVEVREMEIRAQTILRHFDERRRLGIGVYLTREDIERRNTSSLPELLRGQRGVVVERNNIIRFARQQGRACVPDVYIDGQFAPGMPLTSVLTQDVEGVELYSGLSQLPVEFQRPGIFNCGAIVLWTRRPIVLQTQAKSKKP